MYITYSTNNIVFHNSFNANDAQSYSLESQSVWDDGYPNGGNYWSDFQNLYPDAQELDSSGIWDTPYTIDDNNEDNYPLVNG
jgi:nitrous oxidase accessory protein NosD